MGRTPKLFHIDASMEELALAVLRPIKKLEAPETKKAGKKTAKKKSAKKKKLD